MKKPKKTVAKPISGGPPATPPNPSPKSAEAKASAPASASEPIQSLKKAPAKRIRKPAAKIVETTPVAETKLAQTTSPSPKETIGRRARRSPLVAKTAPANLVPKIEQQEIKAAPAPKPLPEIKAAAEIPPASEIKPKPRPQSKAKTKTTLTPASPVEPVSPISSAPIIATPPSNPKPKIETPISPAPLAVKRITRPVKKVPARIPPILLEGDKPTPATASGPGERYALGPTPPTGKLKTEGELPESYGTETLLLTARDPHWLYTHWDLSDEQQRRYNAWSRDGHLVVRIYVEAARGKPTAEIHVHPESRHWFVHVERANTRYLAELGYYSAAEKWTPIATSAATLTPPDAISTDTSAQFTAIPVEVPMEKLLSLVKEAVQENAPLAQALHELRAEGHTELPQLPAAPPSGQPALPPAPSHPRFQAGLPRHQPNGKKSTAAQPSKWTAAQERALAEVISMDHVRRVWMGSLEITELIRRQWLKQQAPAGAPELGVFPSAAPTSPAEAFAITGISSPTPQPAVRRKPKSFWFNVNAELIVYGATEPDATVTIGGRKIRLRPDGSFSYRFALPDGNYEMPAVAVSADQTDGRAADLKFSRRTEYRGDVGTHPQDPALRPMAAENF